MAVNKKGFVLYTDLIHTVKKLPDDKAGELFKHILAYVNDENPITEDLLVDITFEPIKQQLKRDLDKWEQTIEGRSKAGKASAKARRNKKQQSSTNSTNVKSVEQSSTNPTDTVNVTVTVTDNVKVRDNVILKEKEIDSLKEKFSIDDYNWILDKLSFYKLSSGKKYKSDYGAINSWVISELKKSKETVKVKSNYIKDTDNDFN